MSNNVLFDFGDFEITKRELIASGSILAILLIIGFIISGTISNKIADNNLKYDQAIKIDNADQFEYGMQTNVGNAFVYGDLDAIDTVTYDDLDGNYARVIKIKERYTQHTRTYTTTDGKGHTQVHTETYWTWDEVGSETKHCKRIRFCNSEFDFENIVYPGTHHIKTVSGGYHVRYVYKGSDTHYTGTLFTCLKNGTINGENNFYENKSIDETVDYLKSSAPLVIFWILWILLIAGCLFGFYYLDNQWLEN